MRTLWEIVPVKQPRWAKPRYRIVSTYLDGERLMEGLAFTRRGADDARRKVIEFRSDQDEGPRVTVERRW